MSGSLVYFYSVHQGTAATTVALFRVVYRGLQLKVLACGLGRPTGVKGWVFLFIPLATHNVNQTGIRTSKDLLSELSVFAELIKGNFPTWTNGAPVPAGEAVLAVPLPVGLLPAGSARTLQVLRCSSLCSCIHSSSFTPLPVCLRPSRLRWRSRQQRVVGPYLDRDWKWPRRCRFCRDPPSSLGRRESKEGKSCRWVVLFSGASGLGRRAACCHHCLQSSALQNASILVAVPYGIQGASGL
ncbi:hypothetical protein CORC01_09106 [Colletotrichum orchidophilum]|uniref:Uncharacterized protein n=1 Tax=Colletotrichum orchidophilum TaxID=1209926 RepID=A0A1G4B2Q5_9PEZI|nr:uncharacterized protein CORC01_09106 [Colletotrichum orchidophilum]OHE95674.1 hypothetical protein CORC01_09106 [Colletotrichum orchidophilum]